MATTKFGSLNGRQVGVVSLEFILIFPLIIGLLYASLVYGTLFSSKVKLQRVVDAAVTSVYYLDRRDLNTADDADFGQKVLRQSVGALGLGASNLSGMLEVSSSECETIDSGEPSRVVMLECSITVNPAGGKSAFLPQINMSFLGNFPPQPATLSAKAAVTF